MVPFKDKVEAYTKGFLVVVVTLGTLGVIFMMLTSTVEASPQAYLIVGTLTTAFGLIVSYHYGSSSGSAAKQEALDKTAVAKAIVDGKVAVAAAEADAQKDDGKESKG